MKKVLILILVFAGVSSGCFRSDLNCDGYVDFQDFAIFAEDWMGENMISSLVAHFKMNDNAANTAVVNEKGTNGTAAQNTADLTVAGVSGTALTFDGSSDCVNTNQTFQATFRDSFTVNLWCKPDDGQPATEKTIFFGYYPAFQVSAWLLGEPGTGKDGVLRLGYQSNGVTIQLFSDSVFANGQETWHMLSFVVEKLSSSTAKSSIYFDGDLVKMGDETSCTMSNFTTIANFKIAYGAPDYAFDGDIDNVMLFDKVLSLDEVAILYNGGKGTEKFSYSGLNVKVEYSAGSVLYFVLRDDDGKVCYGTDFEVWGTGGRTAADYAIGLDYTGNNIYGGVFPSLVLGNYKAQVHKRAGSSAADSDDLLINTPIYWNGSNLGLEGFINKVVSNNVSADVMPWRQLVENRG